MTRHFLLDTNILSDLIRNPHGRAAQRLAEVAGETVFTSIVVACELRYGAEKRASPVLTQRVNALLDCIPVLPLDAEADRHYAEIRTALESKGHCIGGNDLLIAAHSRAMDATLITHNVREFGRVPGLSVADWLA
jgi:tRNA(fMet)-specific endonuclease VapC